MSVIVNSANFMLFLSVSLPEIMGVMVQCSAVVGMGNQQCRKFHGCVSKACWECMQVRRRNVMSQVKVRHEREMFIIYYEIHYETYYYLIMEQRNRIITVGIHV